MFGSHHMMDTSKTPKLSSSLKERLKRCGRYHASPLANRQTPLSELKPMNCTSNRDSASEQKPTNCTISRDFASKRTFTNSGNSASEQKPVKCTNSGDSVSELISTDCMSNRNSASEQKPVNCTNNNSSHSTSENDLMNCETDIDVEFEENQKTETGCKSQKHTNAHVDVSDTKVRVQNRENDIGVENYDNNSQTPVSERHRTSVQMKEIKRNRLEFIEMEENRNDGLNMNDGVSETGSNFDSKVNILGDMKTKQNEPNLINILRSDGSEPKSVVTKHDSNKDQTGLKEKSKENMDIEQGLVNKAKGTVDIGNKVKGRVDLGNKVKGRVDLGNNSKGTVTQMDHSGADKYENWTLSKLEKELARQEEQLRKLKMVKMYRAKNNLEELDGLIDKWRGVSQQALQDLHESIQQEPKPSLTELINHLGIDHQLIRFQPGDDECFM